MSNIQIQNSNLILKFNIQYSTSTFNIQYSNLIFKFSIQIQYSNLIFKFNIQKYKIQHSNSIFSIQYKIFNIQYSSFNIQHSIHVCQYAQSLILLFIFRLKSINTHLALFFYWTAAAEDALSFKALPEACSQSSMEFLLFVDGLLSYLFPISFKLGSLITFLVFSVSLLISKLLAGNLSADTHSFGNLWIREA